MPCFKAVWVDFQTGFGGLALMGRGCDWSICPSRQSWDWLVGPGRIGFDWLADTGRKRRSLLIGLVGHRL